MNIDQNTKALCVTKLAIALLSMEGYTRKEFNDDGEIIDESPTTLHDGKWTKDDSEEQRSEGWDSIPTCAVMDAFGLFEEIETKILHEDYFQRKYGHEDIEDILKISGKPMRAFEISHIAYLELGMSKETFWKLLKDAKDIGTISLKDGEYILNNQ